MLEMLSIVDLRFLLMVLLGSVAGLFVGAIPGLSVSMATALLVSITYTWDHSDALAMIMGVYVVGVFSGAVSAILINIPGAPSSVVTTLDGYPMSKKGQSYKALFTATIYSFLGSVFGFIALGLLAQPVSAIAIKFTKMDYFLLALFGLVTVGSVSTKNYAKGLVSVMIGLVISMIGLDPLMGTKRLTFGIQNLAGGISTVPALVGFFGFAEVLSVVYNLGQEQNVLTMEKTKVSLKEVLKHWKLSLYTSTIGMLVGAPGLLPWRRGGAGRAGPDGVLSLNAYNEAEAYWSRRNISGGACRCPPFAGCGVEGIMVIGHLSSPLPPTNKRPPFLLLAVGALIFPDARYPQAFPVVTAVTTGYYSFSPCSMYSKTYRDFLHSIACQKQKKKPARCV